MTGVYVHLPFCPYLCPYCDFAKWPLRASSAERYLSALDAEIERAEPVIAQTLYLGGGTPNAYAAGEVAGLMKRLARRFGVERERTIEINPELVRDGDMRAYRSCGVDRLSIGVQSFDARELRRWGASTRPNRCATSLPRHDARALRIDLARSHVRDSGTDGGDLGRIARCRDCTRSRSISAYGLTVEENTPFYAWREREPNAFFGDEAEAELYAMAIDRLRPPATSNTRSATSHATVIAARTISTIGRTEITRIRRRGGFLSQRRSLGADAQSLDEYVAAAQTNAPIPIGGRAPGRRASRRRGDDAGVAHRARGSLGGVQRAIRHRCDRDVRCRRVRVCAERACSNERPIRCG